MKKIKFPNHFIAILMLMGFSYPNQINKDKTGESLKDQKSMSLTVNELTASYSQKLLLPDSPTPDDSDWRTEANKRIQELRMAPLQVKVVDSKGRPAKAADIPAPAIITLGLTGTQRLLEGGRRYCRFLRSPFVGATDRAERGRRRRIPARR